MGPTDFFPKRCGNLLLVGLRFLSVRAPPGAKQYLGSRSIVPYNTILSSEREAGGVTKVIFTDSYLGLYFLQPPPSAPPTIRLSSSRIPRWRGHPRRVALRWPRRRCVCWPPSPPSSSRRVTAGGEAVVFWSTPSDRPSPPRPSRRGGRRFRRRRCRRRSQSPGIGRTDRPGSIRDKDASPSSSPRSQRGGRRRRRRCSAAPRPRGGGCDPSRARRADPSP